MEILLLACIFTAVIGFGIAAGTDSVTEFFISSLAFILAVGGVVYSLTSITQEANNKQDSKHKVICLQIPNAEWIDDLDSCIKDGKVVKF